MIWVSSLAALYDAPPTEWFGCGQDAIFSIARYIALTSLFHSAEPQVKCFFLRGMAVWIVFMATQRDATCYIGDVTHFVILPLLDQAAQTASNRNSLCDRRCSKLKVRVNIQ